MYANSITSKGFISKICKQFIQISIKKKKKANVIKKWEEDLYRPLLQCWPALMP